MNRRHVAQGLCLSIAAGASGAARARPSGSAVAAALDPLVLDGSLPGYSAAVWRNGRLETAFGGVQALGGAKMQEDTIFRIASITKPVTAAAAMMLVEEGRLALDEPVDRFIPELADRKVLRTIASPIGDVRPAARPITLRHLLTQTFGLGAIMEWPPKHPIQVAMIEAGMAPGYDLPQIPAQTYLERLSKLPLAADPGDAFIYNQGSDVAGLLIERASGQKLGDFLAERIFRPLEMNDTGFSTPASEHGRGATLYVADPDSGALTAMQGPSFRFDAPVFESGAGGLSSTAGDYVRFVRMLADRGVWGSRRILSEASVKAMATDQLTPALRTGPHAVPILGSHATWGLGAAVALAGNPLRLPAGAYGWHGGYGTTAFCDPASGLAGVLLTNRAMSSPEPSPAFVRFWNAVLA